MEELPNSSETDMSDGWTIVNGTDDDNVNVLEDTSDSESLEVLEVEQAEPDQMFTQETQTRREENCDGTFPTNNSHGAIITDIPTVHVTTVRKVRKYVHHPNPYINMWLSVVMVIAVAITLGLGIGHYLGTKRFTRAKDLIHHLRYENQILEQELAEIISKHKYCETSLQERVRYFDGSVKQVNLSDTFHCKHYYLQDNIYDNVLNSIDERVCPVKEIFIDGRLYRENEMPPMLEQYFKYFNSDYTKHTDKKNGQTGSSNETHSNLKHMQGDSIFFGIFSPFSKVEDNCSKIDLKTLFFKLNSNLKFLHVFLSKWSNFADENVHSNVLRGRKFVQQLSLTQNSSQFLNEIEQMNVSHLHGNSIDNVSNRNPMVISSNSCCRSKIKQCNLQIQDNKTPKCKVVQRTQMFCTLLHSLKPKKFIIGRSQKREKSLNRKSKVSKLPSLNKKESKIGKWRTNHSVMYINRQRNVKLSHLLMKERKLASGERRNKYDGKYRTQSKDNKWKTADNIDHFSSRKKMTKWKKKGKLDKFNSYEGDREKTKHFKVKYVFEKVPGKGKHHYIRKHFHKDTFRPFQQSNTKYSKHFKKGHKQYNKYGKRDVVKTEYRIQNCDDEKKDYFDKYKCAKNKSKKDAKPFKQFYNKYFHTFSDHGREAAKYQKHSAYSGFHFSEFAGSHKATKKYRKNTNKNHTYLQHTLREHRGQQFVHKYWKEKKNMYRLNMQSRYMNIYKL